ncbi:hypothetical protein MTO96_019540 [Rhipicephalus appendiculatus]
MPRGRQINYLSKVNLFPPANVCDYVLLDLPQHATGSYHYESYEFLRQINTSGYRFLFTVDMDAADISNRMVAFNSPVFNQSTQVVQTSLRPGRLLGYGTLHGWPIPSTTAELSTAQAVLNVIYERLAQVINSSGVDEKDITNFFAFKPRVTRAQNHYYANFMSMLNGLNNLSLVIMLTISDEDQLVVMPSSTWNRLCQPLEDEPKMYTAVGLIANVTNPRVTFTLTISLRLDIFHNVSLATISSLYLRKLKSAGHNAVFFSTLCEQLLFGRDPTGVSILDVGHANCAFASGPSQQNEVITFETPRSVRNKMVATYRRLDYAKTDTHVVGWTVYNVTLGLAPDTCNGKSKPLQRDTQDCRRKQVKRGASTPPDRLDIPQNIIDTWKKLAMGPCVSRLRTAPLGRLRRYLFGPISEENSELSI